MASITIRNLDDDVMNRLRTQAVSNDRSMEAEAKLILRKAVEDKSSPKNQSLLSAIRKHFGPGDGVNLELPPRGPMRKPSSDSTIRKQIVETLASKWNSQSKQFRPTLFAYPQIGKRIGVLLSKHHKNHHRYWYGLRDSSRNFLLEGDESLLILVCRDDEKISIIPLTKIKEWEEYMSRSRNHYNIHIDKEENGNFYIHLQNRPPVSLNKYRKSLSYLLEKKIWGMRK